MVFSLFRKKRRKKPKVRIYGAPPNNASGKISPRKAAPARGEVSGKTKKPATKKRVPTTARASASSTPSRRKRWLGMGLRASTALFILGGVALMFFVATLPDIRDLDKIKKQQGITVQTADGRIIATYGDVYGTYLHYEQFPKSLIQAVIATEDRRFFQHHGVDFFGILRAAIANAYAGKVVQGGSTITQQVAKNVFLTPQRSLTRKIQEVLLAFWLEGRYSKQEIMAIYLNRVYLGAGTFGVDAASRRYFNKAGTDIDLVESAMIAGLLKAPSRYAPTASSQRAMARAHQVLVNMADHGVLAEKAIKPALRAFIEAPKVTVEGGDVRYFSDWIVDTLPDFVGNVPDDMVVVTSFDPAIQSAAADALENTLDTEGGAKKVSQGAVVVTAPDGAVKAMVGGKNYGQSQYNRAAQAKRQPGSSFKLFVYLAALEAGYTPLSQVEDAPITLQVGNSVWSPDNYTSNFKGVVSMAQGFRESLNTVAVRLSQYTGVRRVAQMAERLGIPHVPANPSIALGATEATLLEMTGAYAHLANGGNKLVPYGITEIRTAKGKSLYKRTAPEVNPVLAQGTVEMMNYMLLEVARRGTGTRAALPGRDVAGKTGTSQDYKDAWFIGFTPQLVAGVWVGNDNNQKMAGVTGGNLPALIWHDAMIKALDGVEARSIPNTASSGEGLLPWLFGGDTAATDAAQAGSDGQVPQEIPADSPFGYLNPQAPPGNAAPAAPRPPQDNPSRAPNPPSPDGLLDEKFWNQLMDEVPALDKGKVEYTYPGDDKRR